MKTISRNDFIFVRTNNFQTFQIMSHMCVYSLQWDSLRDLPCGCPAMHIIKFADMTCFIVIIHQLCVKKALPYLDGWKLWKFPCWRWTAIMCIMCSAIMCSMEVCLKRWQDACFSCLACMCEWFTSQITYSVDVHARLKLFSRVTNLHTRAVSPQNAV